VVSVFVLLGSDRLPQFHLARPFLERAGHQLIAACDGDCGTPPAGWEFVPVPRRHGFYCWGDAWAAGLRRCRSSQIAYLDCDRVPPAGFLDGTVPEGVFLYPERLWNLAIDVSDVSLLQRLRGAGKPPEWAVPEPRSLDPADFPCKGPFSGCVRFHRRTYERAGPLDTSYVGWGYPDIDYLMQAKAAVCRFAAYPGADLHLRHGRTVPHSEFMIMNLWNGCRFHAKWGMPLSTSLRALLARHGWEYEYLSRAGLPEVLRRWRGPILL